jgi:D-alanyl-D-alanine carboxypeptidase/D-alanyl-D-alanine-endopeptidase (penicillin-binding protein 4)
MTGSASYDSAYVALGDVMKELDVDLNGAEIQDGSGLSRQNYVSAEFFCRFLEAMMSSPHFETYAASLPSPGMPGTLS